MYKYALIGYYPEQIHGQVYAVGNEGVTVEEAKELAANEGLELFQVFPLPGEGGGHRFFRRQEDDSYKQGRSREFAARLSAYVAGLIQEDKSEK